MRLSLPTLVLLVPLNAAPLAAQWIEPAHLLQSVVGDQEGGQFGYSLARLADCDGDGIADFAVGAALHTAGGPSAGRVSVFSGATGRLLFQRDGQAGDQLGFSVGGGGDVNGDGRGDLVVGAPQRYTGAGCTLVLSGADGSVLLSLKGTERKGRFGEAVEFVGDFNGDGASDIVVGAPGFNCPKSGGSGDVWRDGGRVMVFSGADGEVLATIDGDRYRGRLGAAVHGFFDDSAQLLVASEPGAGKDQMGVVRVFRGPQLDPAFVIEGDAKTAFQGTGLVSVVGDVDADGIPDIYASDWRSSMGGDRTGVVLVHSGATGERLLTLVGDNTQDGFGAGDGRVGDVDGDGHDDLLVGAWLSNDAAEKGGKVLLLSGRDGSEIRRWSGDEATACLGFDAVGMGDVNGDGQVDFLFSAALSDRGGMDAGAVYLVSGKRCEPGEHMEPEPIDLPSMEEAILLLRSGDLAAAARASERIAHARPEDMHAWFLLGLSLHLQGRYEDALAAHLRAARFPEIAIQATYNAACAHALLGNRDQAFSLLDRAMDLGFDDLRHMESDRDLEGLRGDPRWEQIFPVPKSLGGFLEGDASVLLELKGEEAGSHFGWAVAVPGDCDGDGVEDLLVGAPFFEEDGASIGRVDLFSAATGETLRTWKGSLGCTFGKSVAGVTDVDGDGVPECAVGAPGVRGGIGRVFLFSGATGESIFVSEGQSVGDYFGRALAGIGDFNGDGRGDLAVGAGGAGSQAKNAGTVVILSGIDGAVLARLSGRSKGERFGSAVAGIFDATERVLAVGAQNGGPGGRGRIYLYRDGVDTPQIVLESDEGGVDLGRLHVAFLSDLNGDGASEIIAGDWRHIGAVPRTGQLRIVSGRDGSDILRLNGGHPGEGFGIGAVGAGDLDGDGIEDFLAGAWLSHAGAVAGGKVYALSGADGRELATWTSTLPQSRFGSDVVGIEDVNGDGVPDVVVGAPSRARLADRPGRVYILSGAVTRKGWMASQAVMRPSDDDDR